MLVESYIRENEKLIPNMDYLIIKTKEKNITYSTGKFGQDLVAKRFGTKTIKDIHITLNKEIYLEVEE